jgi:hypothetical protein
MNHESINDILHTLEQMHFNIQLHEKSIEYNKNTIKGCGGFLPEQKSRCEHRITIQKMCIQRWKLRIEKYAFRLIFTINKTK